MITSLFGLVNPVIDESVGNAAIFGMGPDYMAQILFRNLINTVFVIGGIYFFIQILISGYNYISAGGEKESIQKATQRIRNAVIGIVLLLSLYAIVWTIGVVFGVNLTELNIPSLRDEEVPYPVYP